MPVVAVNAGCMYTAGWQYRAAGIKIVLAIKFIPELYFFLAGNCMIGK